MRGIRIAGCMIVSLVVLTGCHTDTKQAGEIYQKMEKAASYESEFTKNQDALNETKAKEQEVFEELLDLDVTDTEKLEKKVTKARDYVGKQQELVTNAQEQFDGSYQLLKTIKENAEEIDDEKQQEKVVTMGELMEKRHNLITSFFADYQEQLDLHDSFYAQLEEENVDAAELDEQISTMNDQDQNLVGLIDQFNKTTAQYNQTKGDYYRLADLKEKDIKKAAGV